MVSRPSLSDADRESLAHAIGEGEACTSAELVLVIADSCGSYGVFAVLWPALAALLLGGILAVALPQLAASRLFLIEAGVFAALAAALHWQPALLRVVPQRVRRAHAEQLAAHQFAARIEGRTAQRSGILLFIAMAERQVFILPDSAIAAVITPDAWIGIIDKLVVAIRVGSPVAAIAGAIDEIVAALERHFPPEPGRQDTLPDEVIELSPGADRASRGSRD